jgi:hypothetical protein
MAILGFVAATALVLIVPNHFKEPDDWAYYYATENFSHGQLTIGDTQHQQQVVEAQSKGGQLGQYVRIAPGKWALEKTPGYVFLVVPFYLLGVPQMANILLAAALALVTYLLLKHLKDERAACFGVLLILFTSAGLAMFQRDFMDGFASAAMPGIGGAFYILYILKKKEITYIASACLLFFGGLFLGLGVLVRYTDAVILAVFGLHFTVTRFQSVLKGSRSEVFREVILFGLGAAIPVGLLLLYQYVVFGSPFINGYKYTSGNVKFAYDYLGQPRAWQIIVGNLKNMWRPLFIAFPVLLATVPGTVIALYQSVIPAVPTLRRKFSVKPIWPALDLNITLLLLGWFVAIFGLYMMYEWTVNQSAGRPFIVVTRFYLPALLPMTVMAVVFFSKIPGKLVVVLISAAIVASSYFFVQSGGSSIGGAGPQKPPQNQKPPLGVGGAVNPPSGFTGGPGLPPRT